MFINDFWSEKYMKNILGESKIQENIEKIKKLYRRNMQEVM